MWWPNTIPVSDCCSFSFSDSYSLLPNHFSLSFHGSEVLPKCLELLNVVVKARGITSPLGVASVPIWTPVEHRHWQTFMILRLKSQAKPTNHEDGQRSANEASSSFVTQCENATTPNPESRSRLCFLSSCWYICVLYYFYC